MSRRRVLNFWGIALPCCWDDCWHAGYTTYRYVERHPETRDRTVTYIFCSERHKALWIASYRQESPHGSLPTGSRGTIGPLGLIVP